MLYTLSPALMKRTEYQISQLLKGDSLKPWFTEGSVLITPETGVATANVAVYLIPTMNGVQRYQDVYNEFSANGTIKTMIDNRVTELAITLKEYITETQKVRQRDLQQVGIDGMVSRYMTGLTASVIASVNMTILETVYNQVPTGRIGEGETAVATTVRGAVVDTSKVALVDGDTDTDVLTKSNLFAQLIKRQVTQIRNLKTEEGQKFDDKRLSLILSPDGYELLSYQPLQLFSSALTEASFSEGTIGNGRFNGIPIKMSNQLDVPITQRNANTGAGSILGILTYAGAVACPFVFEGQMNFDKTPGFDTYKLNLQFNTGSGVLFPYLITIFANCGAVADATLATTDNTGKVTKGLPAKSGLTAQARVAPGNINLTKIVKENLAYVRDSKDKTNPAGSTANPAKANDGKGKA